MSLEIFESAVGSDSRPFDTVLTFLISNPDGFTCHVVLAGVVSRVREWLGRKELKVGSDEFDKNFVVKTNDESLAIQMLDERFQFELLNFSKWAATICKNAPDMRVEVAIESKAMSIRLNGFLVTAEQLIGLTEYGKRVWDDLPVSMKM